MYSVAEIKQQISDRGFYVGNILTDLINPGNKAEFDRMRNKAYEMSLDTNNLYYMNCIHGYEGNKYPIQLAFDQIQERKQLIKDKKFQVDQQWHFFGGSDISWWNDFITPVLKDVYEESDRFRFDSRFSLYLTDDFTNSHTDTKTEDRYCAVLIYLTNESEYNDGGGELVLYEDSKKSNPSAVLPLFPTYVILDIKEHSLNHEVLMVKNNFSRMSFLSFVHEWRGWPT